MAKLWEVIGTDIFMVTKGNLLCIVYDFSKFLVVKQAVNILAEELIRKTKVVFTEFGLPKKIVSDEGTNLFQNDLRNFAGALILIRT